MDRVAVLSGSSLFDMLSNEELSAIASLAREVNVPAGHVLFEEGELGDSIYVVVQGEVEVMRRDSAGTPECIASLGPQQFFGEMSLIDKEYRSATVRAKTSPRTTSPASENTTATGSRSS
jgi:CRP/FNR family transcriptional regulator, cyclic AMP receptor protein